MTTPRFRELLESTYKLKEAAGKPPVEDDDELEDEELEDDDEGSDLDTEEVPSGEADYTPDEFREIIDYVYEILDREDDDELNDSVGEIGLDMLYNYADVLPQTVINQIIEDLKEMFEIQDTMLESVLAEGFVKQKKGTVAKLAKKLAAKAYKRNKSKIKLKAKKWRKSARGKKIVALHKKLFKRLGSKKGMRLVSNLPDAPGA